MGVATAWRSDRESEYPVVMSAMGRKPLDPGGMILLLVIVVELAVVGGC